MFVAMPLIAWGADKYAKKKAKEYVENGHDYYGDLNWVQLGSNSYQKKGLMVMSASKEDKAAWLANSDRNVFGFTKVPFIGLGTLVTIITLSALHSYLPAILFSAALVFLTAAGAYTYINRNKQIDNRFKLAFEANAQLEHELYLDEDLTLVDELSKKFNPRVSAENTPQEPGHFASPLYSPSKSAPQLDSSLDLSNELSLTRV